MRPTPPETRALGGRSAVCGGCRPRSRRKGRRHSPGWARPARGASRPATGGRPDLGTRARTSQGRAPPFTLPLHPVSTKRSGCSPSPRGSDGRIPSLPPVALESEVVMPEGRGCVVEIRELEVRLFDVVACRRDECLLVHAGLDALRPAAKHVAEGGQMILDVVECPEVDQRKSA